MKMAQLDRMMKIERLTNPKAYEFMCDCVKHPNAFQAEAEYLARIMTGTNHDGQGIRPEMRHYSGLTRRVNAYLKRTEITTFRVSEQALGDGMSMYYLG